MANGLAIDSSDIDMAVVGINFHGNRDLLLREMQKFKEQLEIIKFIVSIKFIDSATIPVIKLEIDL